MKNKNFSSRDRCPACHSSSFNEFYKTPYDQPPVSEYLESFYSSQGGVETEYLENAWFVLCECDECGLVFQQDIPNDFLMERLYEHWIDPQQAFLKYKKPHGLSHYLFYAQEISAIIAYLKELPSNLSFFDFGMGWGEWALMARGFGCEAFGTELSEERIKHAKSSGINVITWEDIPNHQFDLINTEQVFEHIPEPLETLRHLKRGLKDNGILKISVPTANDIDRRLKRMDWKAEKNAKNSLNPVAPLEHINYFRRNSLLRMAEAAGMEEIVIPMSIQYAYTSEWRGTKGFVKNLLRPIYKNVFKKQNYVFLKNK